MIIYKLFAIIFTLVACHLIGDYKQNRGTHGDSSLILTAIVVLSEKPPLQAALAGKWWEYVTR